MGFVQMKKFLLTSVMAFAFAAPAYAKTCGTAGGTDAAKPGDAALFNIYDISSSCSSDNQANDGDDVKAFLDMSGGTATVNGPDIDFSLSKNTALAADQNTMFKDLSATSSANGFTDGNGFANIKSVGDALQSWEIDPINGSLLPGGKIFNGFDGILFRGQFTDLGGGSAGHTDTGSFTISINLSDGSSITETFSGLKLKADDGVFGFDEIGTLPSGLFVDSVSAQTDANHAWDQIKQVEFSIGGAASSVPEPSTWAMGIIGFGLMAAMGWKRSRNSRHAIA